MTADTTTPARYVVQATTPYTPSDYVPAVRYWNGNTRTWGTYDTATVFDHVTATDDLQGPRTTSIIALATHHDTDLDGYPYHIDQYIGAVRLTHCCAAATSVSDGPLYCKSCYEAVDWAYDGSARLSESEPRREGGPVTITLPPATA